MSYAANTVAVYSTKSGKDALVIKRSINAHGRESFSYMGQYGAGCGHDLQAMRQTVAMMLHHHRGVKLTQGGPV